jgi:hypothetical protein
MIDHVRADQLIEAVIVLGVEALTRGFDNSPRVLRHGPP